MCENVLREHGYSDVIVREAMATCGHSVQRAVEYCIWKVENSADVSLAPAGDTATQNFEKDAMTEQEAAHSLIIDMGFPTQQVTETLEKCDFDFGKTLRLLFAGMDAARLRYEGVPSRMNRHHAKKNVRRHADLPSDAHEQYIGRAQAFLPGHVFQVYDVGMHAGETTAACFWLAFAAAWSRVSESPAVDQRNDFFTSLVTLRRQVRETPCINLRASNRRSSSDPLGLLAQLLRHYFAKGEDCVLRRRRDGMPWFPAFASLTPLAHATTLADYRRWVGRIAESEYADEIVVAAVAKEMQVQIVVVPYTPHSAGGMWAIPQYERDISDERTIYLGNNDVHYVWLAPEPDE